MKLFKFFILWRVALFLISYLAIFILPLKQSFPYTDIVLSPSGLPQWLWSWGGFDGVHYLTIATRGYDGFGTQVFFPFYPMLINLMTRIIPNYVISALLISNISALISVVLLFKLVKKHFDANTANWSVVFYLLFPVSFYLGSIYTESLFLLLLLATFLDKGIWSKITGILCGFTRLVGILVFPGIIGLVGYMIYLGTRFERPLFFLSAQSTFENSRASSLASLVNPLQVIYRYYKIFVSVSPSGYDFWVAFSEISAFLFGFGVLVILTVKRKIPLSWLVFSWGALLIPAFSGTFSSMPRYIMTIFPVYIGLAMIKRKSVKISLLFVFAVLLALATMLYTRGYWVS